MADCPECGVLIEQKQDMEMGEIIQCNDCGTELEIKNVNAFSVGKAPKEQEDWGE